MKNAGLFRNGQSKPEVLKESKSDKIPGERFEEILDKLSLFNILYT